MMIKQKLQHQLEIALTKLNLTWPEGARIEKPADETHGDYASNVALVLVGQNDGSKNDESKNFKNPRKLAEKIVDKCATSTEFTKIIKKTAVAGPGFINFQLSEHFLLEALQQLTTKSTQLPQKKKGQKIIVEYSSPNIAKPFTVGHLRSTIIGDAIANLLEATGAKILRDNHLGDWGTQFGKQIYALKAWGDEAEIENSAQPVKELVKLYVKFHQEVEKEVGREAEQEVGREAKQEAEKDSTLEKKARAWFKKLENGDEEARRLWRRCIEWSWQEFEQIYQRLDISFSQEFNDGHGLGESFFEDKMEAVVAELEESGFLKEGRKGAKLFFFPETDDGKAEYPPAMILKKDGATLYHTRDLATDKYRLDQYQPDLIINEVGAEQKLYFKQLFKMEEMLGWFEPEERIHIKHGLYRFEDKKMSTRRGNVIWLEEVLQEAYDRVAQIAEDRLNQEQIWQVAVGALKWNDLKRKPELNLVFDWDEIVRLDGNSGPYVQYTATRALSVLSKSGPQLRSEISDHPDGISDLNSFNMLERSLTIKLLTFAEIFSLAVSELAPHQICTYLFELAQLFNRFYHQHQILQAETEAKKQLRLKLTSTTATILSVGLELLGIETLEEM